VAFFIVPLGLSCAKPRFKFAACAAFAAASAGCALQRPLFSQAGA